MSKFNLRRLAFAGLLLWSFGALAEHYTVPLFVWAGTADAQQGVLRILNGTDESGTVEIYAIDDAGTRTGPATFTLNAMHDTVRGASVSADRYRYDVPIFNPSSDVTQASRLRLINPADAAASVTIEGRDDSGSAATGGDVTLTLA